MNKKLIRKRWQASENVCAQIFTENSQLKVLCQNCYKTANDSRPKSSAHSSLVIRKVPDRKTLPTPLHAKFISYLLANFFYS